MNTETPLVSNAFETSMRHQRRGAFMNELSTAMQQCVMAVKEHRKGASLTIRITFTPADGEAGMFSIGDDIDVKLPKPQKGNTLFFATDDGRLVRDDPHQKEMDLRIAPAPTAEPIKTIAVNQ